MILYHTELYAELLLRSCIAGHEIRFFFNEDPIQMIDEMFLRLAHWIAEHRGVEGTVPLGFFVKHQDENRNKEDGSAFRQKSKPKYPRLQIRLWISEIMSDLNK